MSAGPTASSIAVGQSVSASTLSGGTVTIGALTVSGSFTFVNPSFTPDAIGTYDVDVRFTPDDTDNLSSVAGGKVSVTVVSLIYRESFTYGASTVLFNTGSLGGWTTSSSVFKFDPTVNLAHPHLGETAGGSMWLDYNKDVDYSRTAVDSSIAFNMTDLAPGEALWVVAVCDVKIGNWPVTANSDSFLIAQQNSGTSYSDLGFKIQADGEVFVRGSDNGGAAQSAYHSTGLTVLNNTTNLLVIRARKGSPSSAPVNSTIDFWLNPPRYSKHSGTGYSKLVYRS